MPSTIESNSSATRAMSTQAMLMLTPGAAQPPRWPRAFFEGRRPGERSVASFQSVNSAEGKPAALILPAARSASSREANGPTRTRIRLPVPVSTTWV